MLKRYYFSNSSPLRLQTFTATSSLFVSSRFRTSGSQNNNSSAKAQKNFARRLVRSEKMHETSSSASASSESPSSKPFAVTSMISEIGQKKLNAALQRYSEKALAHQQQQVELLQKENNNNNNENLHPTPIIELSFDDDNKSLIESIRHDISIVESSGIPPASCFWNDAKLLRRNRYSRLNSGLAVVGGSDTIRRIMENKANPLTPRCLFVPDDIEVLPDWIVKHKSSQTMKPSTATMGPAPLPLVVVRAPRSRINHDLLSAERCDGFAAQFTLPVRLPREFAFISTSSSSPSSESDLSSKKSLKKLNRVAVCHGLRIPSNVGAIIKSAYRNGYDGIVLDRCCELTGEKVLRAAGEAAFDPNFHIFEFGHKLVSTPLSSSTNGEAAAAGESSSANQAEKDFAEGASSGLLLKRIAAAHDLLPLMMIPAAATPFASNEDIGVIDVMNAAKQYHYINYLNKNKAENSNKDSTTATMGTMIVVGGEANGLNGLASEWNRDALFVPLVPVCLQMDNTFINSINVASAAATAMYMFRPGATKEFEEYFRRGIVPKSEKEGDDDDDDDALARLMNPTLVLSAMKDAREQSERLLK